MQISIIKCHGSGNDFILIDEFNKHYNFTENDRKNLSVWLCDRAKGIGSDGILFVMPSTKAEGRMRMFNSDGTEAEMCGNGLRCVARYLIEKLKKASITVETEKADLKVSRTEEIYPGIETFSVAIEPVSFKVDQLPMVYNESEAVNIAIPELSDKRTFTALSVPNPHIISIMDDIDQDELLYTGQKANHLPEVFPNGVNVSFVKILDRNKIFVQTYERGVGLTNACGTAMSASALVSVILRSNDWNTPIVVMNKGGLVHCVVKENEGCYSIQLRGNGTYVYKAEVDVNPDSGSYAVSNQHMFDEEIETYEELRAFAASQSGGVSQ